IYSLYKLLFFIYILFSGPIGPIKKLLSTRKNFLSNFFNSAPIVLCKANAIYFATLDYLTNLYATYLEIKKRAFALLFILDRLCIFFLLAFHQRIE
ncbi:hypothetical protein, partial [Pasteurella multocida]|uniref:hypothetical protein n=1 Tax=Pasteurella multocida TaxID=747 RepID=UPI003CECB02A